MSKEYEDPFVERLLLEPTDCTRKLKLRPVRCKTISFVICEGLDRIPEYTFRNLQSLIHFDTRQEWECYRFDFNEIDRGWVCDRKNIFLRLADKEFEEIFGDFDVETITEARERRKREGTTALGEIQIVSQYERNH